MLTEDGAVYIMETVARDQTILARRTGETLEVVDVALRPHHHLTGRD